RERTGLHQSVGAELAVWGGHCDNRGREDQSSRRSSRRKRSALATYDSTRCMIMSRCARPSLITAGEPTAIAPDGTSTSYSTTELAATIDHECTTERCSTIAALTTSASSSIVHPSR